MLKTLFQRLIGRRRVTVMENQRALYFENGQLEAILTPGRHFVLSASDRVEFDWHDITALDFKSRYESVLFDRLPDEASRHLTVFRTDAHEVAIIERDGMVAGVMGPDTRRIVWTAAGPWTATPIDVSQMPAIQPKLMRRLAMAGRSAIAFVTMADVPEGHAGLLFVDGALAHRLSPGAHAYWTPGRQVRLKLVDLRLMPLEVSGQEILTRDKVSVRVNIAAQYRVTDPVLAVTMVPDFGQALYGALQQAFRRMLGGETLDALLERKSALDEELTAEVRTAMTAIGIEVAAISLKDVILPGEMRAILNRVVAAEKEAEANVIRRREETNATRSLLNTAKVMAENPVMLRLKELEELETIAGRVERLTIHNGAEGLMNGLVHLQDA
ncbi:SPFH domain-containing protein [Fulvimarina sp. MAC3]|uniref:slipin family protein n=1 Tax=Fulvimarina sp. MAC3 TaxID=3148887 RepID=UPI0031FE3A17